jgi:hypothetical protein
MKSLFMIWLAISLMVAGRATGQEAPSNDEFAPLVFGKNHSYGGRVEGRFDHMGVDAKGNRVLAAVYGILDVAKGKRIQSIHAGFIKPQMAAYIPELNRIVVSNEGDGSCKIFDASTY